MPVLLAALAVPSSSAPASPQLEMVDLPLAQSAMVVRAVGLFADAGLRLPPLAVRTSDRVEVCHGRIAFHRADEHGSEIVLCYPEVAGREWRVLLHELAHAWASVGMSAERKDAFQRVRGWEHWRADDVAEWADNGNEQAAEIVKWGVSDVPVPVFIDQDSCDELHEGYVALVGAEPPHGSRDLCDR